MNLIHIPNYNVLNRMQECPDLLCDRYYIRVVLLKFTRIEKDVSRNRLSRLSCAYTGS